MGLRNKDMKPFAGNIVGISKAAGPSGHYN
jgi:hypothetical protein